MEQIESLLIEHLKKQKSHSVEQKSWPEVVKLLDQILDLEPDDVQSWQEKGFVSLYLEQYQQAWDCFEKSKALAPFSRPAWEGAEKARDRKAIGIEELLAVVGGGSEQPLGGNTRQFGRYQIREQIGQGGMGKVYRAYEPSLKREVALKTALKGGDNMLAKRFVKEVETMAKLSHPNIVKIFDVGNVNNIPYYAMEFVAGQSLSQLLKQERMDVQRAAEILRKVALAVHHANSKGILHRDIKPSNIMLDSLDEPKIMDFGLALDVNNSVRLSQTGVVVGTPAYMSPEQVQGKKRQMDERSDVYSLGAVFYEMLTGQPPFQGGSTQKIFERILTQEPTLPSRVQPGLPKSIEKICLKAMAKEKEWRYRNAEELAADLDRFLSLQEVLATSPGLHRKMARWCKRNPVVAGAICLVLGIGFTFALLPESTSEYTPQQTENSSEPHWQNKPISHHDTDRNSPDAEKAEKSELPDQPLDKEEPHVEAAAPQGQPLQGADAEKLKIAQKWLHTGVAYYRERKTAHAIQELQKACDLVPGLAMAHFYLGLSHIQQGTWAEAIDSLNKAKELEPGKSTTFFYLGMAYEKSQRFQESIKAYRKSIELSPRLGTVYCHLGGIYLQQGQYVEAAQVLAEGVKYHNCPVGNYKAGLAYHMQKRFQQAIGHYRKAIQLDASLADAWCKLGEAYLEMGQNTQGLEILQKTVTFHKCVVAYYNLGIACLRLKRNPEAIDMFRRCCEMRPTWPEPHYCLGLVYANAGDGEQARRWFTRYLELAPSGNKVSQVKKWLATGKFVESGK